MTNVHAAFTVQNWGERYHLIDWTVMLHLDQGLELLNNTTLWSENVVLHVSLGEEISLFFQMIDDSEFGATSITVLNSIVQDWSIEPGAIIKNKFLIFVLIFDLIAQKVRLIESTIVDYDILREVRNHKFRSSQVMVFQLWVISISDIKLKIWEWIF